MLPAENSGEVSAIQSLRQLRNEMHSTHLATGWSLVPLMKIHRELKMKNQKNILLAAFFFEARSHSVPLAGLELTLWTRLALNSWSSSSLYLPSAGIKDVCHHAQSVLKEK